MSIIDSSRPVDSVLVCPSVMGIKSLTTSEIEIELLSAFALHLYLAIKMDAGSQIWKRKWIINYTLSSAVSGEFD